VACHDAPLVKALNSKLDLPVEGIIEASPSLALIGYNDNIYLLRKDANRTVKVE
jgi:hypothetical protein